MQQRQVALEDGRVEQEASARPRKHRLDQDRAAEQVTQLQAHHRQRRGRCIFDHMPKNTHIGQALGAQTHDELLRQDVGNQGPHRPRNDAHRDHAHGDGGQEHVLEVLPIPNPLAGATRPSTARRQPHQDRRKHNHQDHAQPIVRNADPQHRQQRGKFIEPRVLEIPGHKTKQTAQHKPDQGRQQGEAQGVAHGGHDLRSHRAVAGNRCTQIALQSTPDPGHKLFRVRAVEPVELDQLRLQVGRGVWRQNRHQRITGRQVHQAKTNQRHTQHDGQGINQSPQQKAEHASTPKLQLKKCAFRPFTT